MKEKVNHPSHYNSGRYEVIDFIEDYGLDFHTGNIYKYLLRAGKKDSFEVDMLKAMWYLERVLERPSGQRLPPQPPSWEDEFRVEPDVSTICDAIWRLLSDDDGGGETLPKVKQLVENMIND